MGYDINKLVKKAVKFLENNPKVVTDLQIYGNLGVSLNYWCSVMKKSDKYDIIDELLSKNRARGSVCVTDGLESQVKAGNVRAMELYGKIIDKTMKEAWTYKGQEEAREEEDSDSMKLESLRSDIKKLVEDNGFH